MNSISFPEKWLCVPLLSTCDVKTGKVDANHASDSGKFKFFTCALEPLKADTYSFDGDLIILPGNGANVGHVIFHSGKIEAYQRTYVLHKFVINPKYIYYCLLKNWKEVNLKKQYGSATNYIKMSNFQEFELPLPPLAEQKIIADKLDTLLAQVETTKARLERIPEILKTFRQSVLAAAVSGKLTEEWRAEGFTLASIADFQNGFAFKSGWFEANGEYQVVKLGNIRDGNLALENSPAYLKKAIAEEYLRFVPQTGDTLLSMTGTRFKKDYGFGCIIKGESNLLVNQRVGRLIPNRELVLPEYLNIFVRSELFRVQFFKGETGGVNQGNVGSKHIMGIKITLPSIDQQTKIVSRVKELFSFADNIEQKANAALKRVNNLTQSILAKAFRGQLTAEWREANPGLITGENSAESLLRRITAEQKKLLANKPRRRKRCDG